MRCGSDPMIAAAFCMRYYSTKIIVIDDFTAVVIHVFHPSACNIVFTFRLVILNFPAKKGHVRAIRRFNSIVREQSVWYGN